MKTKKKSRHGGSCGFHGVERKGSSPQANTRKRLPLRISPTAGYVTQCKQAEEKWKTYHSNLYDESQLYHLLSVIFPNAQPVNSTFNVHNGNFKACGEIVAASIAQGGPAPRFLEESVA